MVKPSHEVDDDDATSPGRMAEFIAFLKSARSFKGDLSAITAPAFILSPMSLTEYPSFWCEEPSLMVAPAKQEDKVLRSLAVLTWYLSTLGAQFGKRRGSGPTKKKPLNPILGELFLGHWHDEQTGETELVVEQVRHHPPTTAYRIWNEKHGITLEGYHVQKTYFRGMPHIERVGHVMLRVDGFDENYLITLPSMHLEGLIPPPPYPELDGKSNIVGSNGMTAEIEYCGRGWWKGKKNSFHAKLYTPEKEVLYTVEGQWLGGGFTIRKGSNGKPVEAGFHSTAAPQQDHPTVTVRPVDEQGPLESRRVWHKVAEAIEKGDMGAVNREKHKIEEEQRVLRKKEKMEGIEWQTRYFAPGEWKEAETLLAKIGRDIRREETQGVWRWKGSSP